MEEINEDRESESASVKDAENVNQEKGLERSKEVRESVEDKDSDCESEVNEEESESENEQSDSENERLIISFVKEYELVCWRKQ